jgi:site-specific recombinase XerD
LRCGYRERAPRGIVRAGIHFREHERILWAPPWADGDRVARLRNDGARGLRQGAAISAAVRSDAAHVRFESPGVNNTPALFLNQRGQRLSVRGAHDIITGIAAAAGLDDDTTVHILRRTFATTLVRGGTDLVIVAELLGHARLETTRGYTRPSAEDRTRALDLLPVDK